MLLPAVAIQKRARGRTSDQSTLSRLSDLGARDCDPRGFLALGLKSFVNLLQLPGSIGGCAYLAARIGRILKRKQRRGVLTLWGLRFQVQACSPTGQASLKISNRGAEGQAQSSHTNYKVEELSDPPWRIPGVRALLPSTAGEQLLHLRSYSEERSTFPVLVQNGLWTTHHSGTVHKKRFEIHGRAVKHIRVNVRRSICLQSTRAHRFFSTR
ncbi:hypothetical protein SELMODRAFT_417878 [Selaginella moellendorffii]|uniref:Uncharacterized protein n=1 Tax=Selaginella moellendorffii TaxID=88036 RepID=D8S3Y2_SELML|nr:hypothetical protein SELMODRAFT_417878 [Selaginella moellendorffii]